MSVTFPRSFQEAWGCCILILRTLALLRAWLPCCKQGPYCEHGCNVLVPMLHSVPVQFNYCKHGSLTPSKLSLARSKQTMLGARSNLCPLKEKWVRECQFYAKGQYDMQMMIYRNMKGAAVDPLCFDPVPFIEYWHERA